VPGLEIRKREGDWHRRAALQTYTCQAYTFGNVKATGTVAPKTALALSRYRLSGVVEQTFRWQGFIVTTEKYNQ